MKHEIVDSKGVPVLNIKLTDGESIFSTDSTAAWLTSNFEIKTATRGSLGSRVSGDAVPATTYTCKSGIGTVTFTGGQPGTIIEFALKPTSTLVVQQGALVAAEESVKLSGTRVKPLEGTLYGAKGYGLQRFSGPGLMFVRSLGGVVEQTLGPNDTLWAEPAHVLMFDASVNFEIAPVKNSANLIAGSDEKMQHALLKGPGKVWLQTSSKLGLRGR